MIDGHIHILEDDYLDGLIDNALHEDIAFGDLTTEALIDSQLQGRARLLSCQEAVLAGLDVFARVFNRLDQQASFEFCRRDGEEVSAGEKILEFCARTESILKGERTALNFVQHLSGVATRTRAFVKKIGNLPVTLLDTRKTTPGLRALEKYAVRVGGGKNHRFGLFDGILIKDNHRAVLVDLPASIRSLKKIYPFRKIEVECSTDEEVLEALEAGADIILMDNMEKEAIAKLLRKTGGRGLFEVSGNIGLHNIEEMACTGVEFISAGTIIHGAAFVDMSLEIVGHDPAAD